MKKILFICMGNICRSAMAEGILREKINTDKLPLMVDSAGTHSYHKGQKYDPRARAELKKHGIGADDLRSRPVQMSDFDEFDVLFAADSANLRDLHSQFGKKSQKVQLMTAYSKQFNQQNVPDPYYGGDDGFARVYDMLEECNDCWLKTEGL